MATCAELKTLYLKQDYKGLEKITFLQKKKATDAANFEFVQNDACEIYMYKAKTVSVTTTTTTVNTGRTETVKKKAPTVSCSQYPSTPFTSQAEGDAFRKWVHENQKEWATTNNLDISYPKYNNCHMRKAWSVWGTIYQKTDSGTQSITTLGVTPESQEKLFNTWISQSKLENGVLLKLDTDKTALKDSFGLTNYAYCYAKKYQATRDKDKKITAVGNEIKISDKSEVVYSDDSLITLLFYDFKWGYLVGTGSIEMANYKLTWSPGASKLFTLENKRYRKTILEQTIDFSGLLGTTSGSVGTSTAGVTNLSGGLSLGTQGSQSTVQTSTYGTDKKTDDSKSETNQESKKTTDSLQMCSSLTNRQDQLRCQFGFIDEQGKTFSPSVKIKTMNQDPSRGIAGEGSIQYIIDNYKGRSYYFDDYNEMMDMEGLGEYKLKYPTDYPQPEYAGKIIDSSNFSGLIPLEGSAAQQYNQYTFGKLLATNSTLTLLFMQSGRQAVENIPAACTDKPEIVREKLKTYLTSAFLGTRKYKTDYENLTYLNRCFATNKINEDNFIPFTRTDFPDVNEVKLPFGVLKKELDLNDVLRLLRGDVINGIRLHAQFQDRDFATADAVYESTNNTIKKHITEAVKIKNKVKIKNTIITEILLEMKG